MKLQRFIDTFDLSKNTLEITESELVNQLKNVFRFSAGDRFILCDGNGTEAEVVIQTIDQKSSTVKIEKAYQNTNEPQTKVHLFCSILKRENFELVVQKATEVGVTEITPILCERTVKTNLNLERLKKIAHEAAEQSSRGIVPIIHEVQTFRTLLTKTPAYPFTGLRTLFDSSGFSFHTCSPDHMITSVFIGPEGGWSPSELELAKSNKVQIASLGSLTLRGETAAIIASYLCTHPGLSSQR